MCGQASWTHWGCWAGLGMADGVWPEGGLMGAGSAAGGCVTGSTGLALGFRPGRPRGLQSPFSIIIIVVIIIVTAGDSTSIESPAANQKRFDGLTPSFSAE
jgi:hypothetical protein